MAVFGLPITQGLARPLFHLTHKAMAAALLASLWWTSTSKGPNRALVYVAIGLFVLTAILPLLRTILRSYSVSKGWTKARARKESGVLVLTIALRRPLKIRAGQYLYVRIPSASPSILRSHCLAIAWWEGSNRSTSSLSLLVESRGSLGQQLEQYVSASNGFSLLVDGPYGGHLDNSRFETLVLFATDMGIAAQLSQLKERFIQGDQNKTRRIVLVWEVGIEGLSFSCFEGLFLIDSWR